ncbi:class II glutamine amidotransferase [Sulfuricaulis sp.]|jgi:predicted glutamine amidotransferase|uniref:class II glutamine amidotransferase n=1 Tax=Sulfuricaulis sp. TaxID=2003553 RepID=UPI00355A0758
MCELFGLSSNRPVPPGELLRRFGARGGNTADNPDGWGLATLNDSAFRLTKEPNAAAHSARFQQLCGQTHSSLILGHVRKANPPTAKILENTHPFRRVCCGREWVFAHNGIIPDTIALGGPGATTLCALSGDTDSEHAFCVVLDRIATAFSSSAAVQGHEWLDALARAAEMLASHGRFNFLMSDGVHLIAYGHDRLHSLADTRATFWLDAATETAVIATEPLTEDSGWLAFEPGELRVYRAGRQIARFITHPRAMAPVPDGDLPRTKTIVPDTGRHAPLKNGASP